MPSGDLVSLAIDSHSGAMYHYPDTFTVSMTPDSSSLDPVCIGAEEPPPPPPEPPPKRTSSAQQKKTPDRQRGTGTVAFGNVKAKALIPRPSTIEANSVFYGSAHSDGGDFRLAAA